MKMYTTCFLGGLYQVVEIEVSSDDEMYHYRTKEEAQEECDYWNKELNLNNK